MNAVTGPGSYWQISRAPRYSLLFALPLLLFYQILASLQPVTRSGAIRNGADALLESLFIAVAGRWGPLAFMVCLIGFGSWLVARDLKGRRLTGWVFAAMLGEATVLALLFGVSVGRVTWEVVRPAGPPAMIGAAQIEQMAWTTRLMLSVGAGLYEELLFRVLLVAGLAGLARAIFGWRPAIAGVWATLVGAFLFSAAHYIGPYGDRLTLYSFVFRMIAGVFFSALYLLRGFGITAWTHALYDAFLLVA